MLRMLRCTIPVLLLFTLPSTSLHAQEEQRWLEPYVMASNQAGRLNEVANEVKEKLTSAGFEIAGEYSPYESARVIVVTNEQLRAHAARSEFGGYGAAVRVGVTQAGDNVQVAFVNPEWMANTYRMKDELRGVATGLKDALGYVADFGTENLWSAESLRKYHYMIFMPYFDDPLELAQHDSYEAAVQAVESGLAEGKGGTAKVYRIDIPGKQESVFGVAIEDPEGGDKVVMETCDIEEFKHTPHLPYELLVSGNRVYALHGKFRIAQSFPDLTMGTFMKISDAPDAIETALAAAAGGKR